LGKAESIVVKTVVENRFGCECRKSVLVLSPRPARACRHTAQPARFPGILEKQIWVLAALVLMSALSYYLINRYALSTVVVQGRSMAPTLEDGDRFLLNRLSFLAGTPKRGDLVVLHDPGHGDLAVKRIVGLPGERIEIKEGVVFVNGRRLREIYLAIGTETLLPQGREAVLSLGAEEYFVLGDNREQSEDSRAYGAIGRERIVGALIK
jgi:signal peptidase I